MGGVASTPCISDGHVYVGTTNGYLHCLDFTNGGQEWAQPTTNRSDGNSIIISSPVVYDKVVYITNEASKIYAFNADLEDPGFGDMLPGYPVELPILAHGISAYRRNITGASSPAIAPNVNGHDYLLVGCDDGYIYRMDLADRSLAEIDLGGCVESSPTVVGEEAFVGCSRYYAEEIVRLSIDPFEILAHQDLEQEIRATVAYGWGHPYVGVDTGNEFHKLDPLSLLKLATFATEPYSREHFVSSAALSRAGVVYVGNDNGNFYVLSASDLVELSVYDYYEDAVEFNNKYSSNPAIARIWNEGSGSQETWVYVTTRAEDGQLLAFKPERQE
jgi:outer membrane protein assembly factor BamB